MSTRTKEVPVAVVTAPASRTSKIGKVLAGAIAAIALLAAVGHFGIHLLPSIHNPFGTKTVDRTKPALMQSLSDLSRYDAATANFQVIVDTEKDAKFTPSIIRGERTVYLAVGSVDASVDFSSLDERSIQMSDDRRSVTVNLPAPTLSEPHLDLKQSEVVSRQRGLLDRLGSIFSSTPTSEHPYQVAASAKMADAANNSDLRNRAEQNTRTMLQHMLGALGFTSVTVNFAPNPA
jgi:hypothetical protein